MSVPAHSEVVSTVARLAPQKGHDLLIEAIPAVMAARPDCAVPVGRRRPASGRSLRARLRAEGLELRVHLLGKRPDVPDLLAAADLFVLPSHFEGLPLSVLEAMGAGLPVVATRVSGTSEAVADGVTGRLVEPNDPAALATAMIDALEQPRAGAPLGRGRPQARRRQVQRGGHGLRSIRSMPMRSMAPMPGRGPAAADCATEWRQSRPVAT